MSLAVKGRHGRDPETRSDSRGGCGRIQPTCRRGRGSHTGAAPRASQRSDRSDHRRASRARGEAHRRRHPHRVPQRGRCRALRHRGAERHGRAQRRPAARAPHRVPRRHPSRRCGRGERRRPDGRWRQYRRAVGRHRQARRDLSVRRSLLAGEVAARSRRRAISATTELKNIAEPVRVYSLQVGVPAQAKPAAPLPQTSAPSSHRVSPSLYCPSPISAAIPSRNILPMASPRASRRICRGSAARS